MTQKSLYDVLLVDQNASLDEIKLAFKRRALQVHPDKGGSKEEFHLVYQALETLGDPAARQKYDHSLAATKTGPAPRASHPSHAPYPKEKKRKREEKPAHPAKQSRKQNGRCLKRSRQLLLARLQVKLHGLQLQLCQQNRNLRKPSC